MADFKINGRSYRSNKIDLFTQLKLEKRIGVVYPALAAAKSIFEADPILAAGYATTALNRLSDDDLMFVVGECLSATQVEQAATLWVPVKTSGALALQFDGLTLADIHMIVFYVLFETFAPFIDALPSLISTLAESFKKPV